MHFSTLQNETMEELGKAKLLDALQEMLLIRQFETRAESVYQQGKIGGFFHSYIGQEAIQTAATMALGKEHWYTTTYRCHALALLLGATPNELMAELLGKENGNAKGRGGSMHFFLPNMLGGFGIVGAHLPIAAGAAFSLKYKKNKEQISICFLGDGAVAQGAFHESLNLAALWNLPALYVIENNHWGMGTAASRALIMEKLAEENAPSYRIQGDTFDGLDFLTCYHHFKRWGKEVRSRQQPVLLEAITERFRGHSISDPALYRTKQELEHCMKKDPIFLLKEILLYKEWISEEEYKKYEKAARQKVIEAVRHAEESPWPNVACLEEEVFAKEDAV